jgi:hypothetical protein
MTTKKTETPKETNNKIPRDMAEAEFERFAEYWDIDTDVDSMSPEDKDSFEGQKSRIIRAVMSGRAVVESTGELTYTLREAVGNHEKITFKMPKGEAFIEMDKHKERQSMHKVATLVSKMTGVHSSLLSRFNGNDMKFCLGFAGLFLGS